MSEHPQDAPVTQPVGSPPTQGMRPDPTAAWPTWRPGPAAPAPSTPPEQEPGPVLRSQWTPPPVPPSADPAPPRVTHLPPPGGPNWGLVLLGVLVIVLAAGIVATRTIGFRVSEVTTYGPGVVVVAGLFVALVGLVGIVSRRRR